MKNQLEEKPGELLVSKISPHDVILDANHEFLEYNELGAEAQVRFNRISKLEKGLLFASQPDNSDLLREIKEIKRDTQIILKQNIELLNVNKQLEKKLGETLDELNFMKEQRQQKEIRKQARAKRKRLPKRDPMTAEIYKELIKAAEGPSYTRMRTRLAMCLLAITGIRINELLSLKVGQLKTLTEENWIAIDRSKRGPSSHKAFLNKEGKKIIKDRGKDFQRLFLMKEPENYIFTSELNHSKPLRREIITNNVNKLMAEVSTKIPENPNLSSHSFRIGYINKLWKDTKDIEFVKQTIGHRNLNTTSSYVNNLSDNERKQRIEQLN